MNHPGESKEQTMIGPIGRRAWFALLLASANCSGSGGNDAGHAPATAPASALATSFACFDALAQALRVDAAHAGVTALALAIVDPERVLFCDGVTRSGPLPDDARFRAGSVSKMFTDIAALQLVEEGRLDLDQPITNWLPEFAPQNPFGGRITLRQLMAHRAGLVREPPRGSYFDAAPPSLAETVASLNATKLVDPPGARMKYSNAGLAVVGRVIEVVTGQPFETAVETRVLAPMGMAASRFARLDGDADRLLPGELWSHHLAPFPAPTFPFGIAPAANLEASIADLAEAARRFLRGGRDAGGAPIAAETLAEMWRVQDGAEASDTNPAKRGGGFGFGFWIDEFEGRRRISHDGAVYGFSTLMVLLPDQNLGVVLAASKDCVHPWLERLAAESLRIELARRAGAPSPPVADRGAAPKPSRAFEQRELDRRVARRDATFPPRPPPPSPALVELVGEYGFDFSILYVREEAGTLHTRVEWFFDDALTPAGGGDGDGVWDFPPGSLYEREQLRFVRGGDGFGDGQVSGAFMAGIWFPRRVIEPKAGAPFRVTPTGPIAPLMAAARAAALPESLRQTGHAADLVDLAKLDAGLRFDIRYATADNFLGAAVYPAARAFLQRPVAQALVRAQRSLAAIGLGLLVHDGYRPWHVTKLFWDATPTEHHEMVADPAQGSRHNRGCAVDLSLCELATGAVVPAPSGYDEFSPRANPWWPGGSAEQRWSREVLRRTLEAEGFTVYPHEWWHFDFSGWEQWPVLDASFAEIDAARAR